MRLQDPRYTGANRCWPCTLLNAAIVVAVAALTAFAVGQGAAGAIAVFGFAAIAARGYVVPGTPQFTRALPDSVLAHFDKGGTGTSAVARIEGASLSDVLVETESGPLLIDSVRTKYENRAAALTRDRERLEDEIERAFPSIENVSVNRSLGGGENWFAHDQDGNVVVQWSARPVAAMDAASVQLFESLLSPRNDRTMHSRRTALALLRRGTRTCPECESELSVADGPTVSCCGGRSLVGALRCGECGYAVVDSNDLPAAEEPEVEADRNNVGESASRFSTHRRR